MPRTRTSSGGSRRYLEEYRATQVEMLRIAQEYSRARLSVFLEEARSLGDTWRTMAQEWQGAMEQAAALSAAAFEEIAARGEAAAGVLHQSWQSALAGLSGEVEQWGEQVLQTLSQVATAWNGSFGGSGSSGGGVGLLAGVLDLGGWFHRGGIVEAHQGLAVSPASLMADEQLILAQAGEGILPKDSMLRLGEKNFEALRSGRFDAAPAGGGPRYEINIQVQLSLIHI